MIKNIDSWIEQKVQQYVERDVKKRREYLTSEWVNNAPSDATQEDFEEFCSGLEMMS